MGNSETRRRAAKLRRDQIRAKMPHTLAEQDGPPRFVADVMLGKLAKWLRIAGYDVLYSNKFTDDALIALSREEGRILLSLDSRLLVRKRVERFIFLQGSDLESQLRQILEATCAAGLPSPFSRCLSCNETLTSVAAESVRCRVPPYVYRTQSHFKMCPKCGRIFWSGTHRRSIAGILDRIYAGLPDADAASC